MTSVVFIPARYGSQRYPGKPLAMLRQPDGNYKTLIQMTWEAANEISGIDGIFVTTDDRRIAKVAMEFGADVLITSQSCENGTARCAEALHLLADEPDVVVNFQGDAPLTPPWFIEALISHLKADDTIDVATPVLQCDSDMYQALRAERLAGRVGGTTAVFDNKRCAMYFSKEVIPFVKSIAPQKPVPVFHHVGVYAYRPQALDKYASLPACELEIREGLEQLRFLSAGIKIACVLVDSAGRMFWELNNPEDVNRIELALEQNS